MCCLEDHTVKSWSSTQSIIALSAGEAEQYAINKCAAMALGLQSLLNDTGVSLDVKLFTDASTGKSMATRRGLGKVRHISINELWIQAKVAENIIAIVLFFKFNPADLMTKYLSKEEIRQIMDGLMHRHSEGRSDAAPELSFVTETSQDSWQDTFPRPLWYECKQPERLPQEHLSEKMA